MRTASHLLIAVGFLLALAGCRSAQEQPRDQAITTVTTAGRSEAVNAVPTGERGLYQVNFGMEEIAQVRVVPKKSQEGRLLDSNKWSFDPSTGSLRVDAPVDDATEIVCVLGSRKHPPEIKLPEKVDLSSVRVVVGDRLGVEGKDYTLDRQTGLLRLRGSDAPDAPLRYFVQGTLQPDPAHPGIGQGFAMGNMDGRTAQRVLEAEGR